MLRFRSILRSLSTWACAQGSAVPGPSPHENDAPVADRCRAEINVLSLMCSKEYEDPLKAIAKDQCWSYARARTWTEGLSAVAAATVSVVMLDRAQLGADWRYLLGFLWRRERHCFLLIIDTPGAG